MNAAAYLKRLGVEGPAQVGEQHLPLAAAPDHPDVAGPVFGYAALLPYTYPGLCPLAAVSITRHVVSDS